jgi:hypothetical protein
VAYTVIVVLWTDCGSKRAHSVTASLASTTMTAPKLGKDKVRLHSIHCQA